MSDDLYYTLIEGEKVCEDTRAYTHIDQTHWLADDEGQWLYRVLRDVINDLPGDLASSFLLIPAIPFPKGFTEISTGEFLDPWRWLITDATAALRSLDKLAKRPPELLDSGFILREWLDHCIPITLDESPPEAREAALNRTL